MDYGTFFFTNIASVTAFAICIGLLAWFWRGITGMRWFAVAIAVGWAKLFLQGLEGKVPVVLSSMIANELYLVAFVLQFMGFRWFIIRTPLRQRWPWFLLALLLILYTILYLCRLPYTGNLMNIPFVTVCGISAWMLFHYGRGPFRILSRYTSVILVADMCVAGYRAILTNLRYMRPWETVNADADPRWLYSLAGMAFLATFMSMSYLWFLMAELGRVLAEQARTDPLTGILNRRAMEEVALRETARSMRHGRPLCMIMIDVDNFKHLNDTRGHAAGDCMLQAMVCTIKNMLRASDLFARTGGEEFAVLLPDTSPSAGLQTAERIRHAVEALEVPFESGPLRITISAGVTQLGSMVDGWESMMRRADAAMYTAKQHGRNQVSTMFSSEKTTDAA
ncbi:MAG: GGDEF domain-containing protein [Terracidiphilus sp.]|nr:GGDEF domain-containing protein [Terracidiphilus sp.]